MLRQQKMKHIDFIQILPYHILSFIFERFPLSDLIRYTRVSKAWRSFLLSWPGLFRDLSDRRLHITQDLANYKPYFDGKCVRIVHILGRSTEEQEQILMFLIQHHCSYIESINIVCDTTEIAQLARLLNITGSSLKSLRAYTRGARCILPVILNLCTNLKNLHFSHSTEDYQPISSKDILLIENIQKPTSIQYLSLDILMPLPLLKNTLRLFPHLTRVEYNTLEMSKHGGSILECLHKSCPNLEHVQVGGEITAFTNTETTTTTTTTTARKKSAVEEESMAGPVANSGGWRVLILSYQSELSDTQLAPIFGKHGETLEAIHIEYIETLGDTIFSTLAMTSGPNLQYLCLRLDYSSYERGKRTNNWSIHFQPEDMCMLIHQASNLKEVNFSFLADITDAVLDALAKLENLAELEIGHCENVTTTGLCRFIQYNTNEIYDGKDTTSLKQQGLGRGLKRLHLLGMDSVTDQVLYATAHSSKTRALESLDVGNNKQITEKGLYVLVDQFSKTKSLKWLGINHCANIHPHNYEYACQQLNNTKVYRSKVKPGYNISLSR